MSKKGILSIMAVALGVPCTSGCSGEDRQAKSIGGSTQAVLAALDGERPVIPGLHQRVRLVRDETGIVHIRAHNQHDLYLAQGWVHARDRFFQMDVTRRQASGTLAELLGQAVLAGDVEARTIGLRRAAERSLQALSPAAKEALESYAKGVNAYLSGHTLPPEYTALEIETVEPWSALDSVTVAKALAFELSFDLDDLSDTQTLGKYRAIGAAAGFDGTALFFEDLFRTAPFDLVSTVPEASRRAAAAPGGDRPRDGSLSNRAAEHGSRYLERVRSLPFFRSVLGKAEGVRGSNGWVVSGALTRSGRPLVANDPHLDLTAPSIFYPVELAAPEVGLSVIGASFAGIPYVARGHNADLAWGLTTNAIDVTDVYLERIAPDPRSPSGLSTVYRGALEPVVPVPVAFRLNVIGDGVLDNLADAPSGSVPPVVLIVPRRNLGPIVSLDTDDGTAISVQYTGFSPTRELDAFRLINEARNVSEFKDALQYFDVGSQNFFVADRRGDIAYFTSAELPLREDLQAGRVAGAPPFLIRDGQGGNEWVAQEERPADQALPYAILPFDEMPQIVNPAAGYALNANNDPLGVTFDNDPLNDLRPGGGLLYLGRRFNPGLRAKRIGDLLAARLEAGPLRVRDMKAIQADVVLRDAQVFVPMIVAAYTRASAPGAAKELAVLAADARVREAVGRLSSWDHTTPTGVVEGYDAGDRSGCGVATPSRREIDASVAATIYSTWRGQIIRSTVDAVAHSYGLERPSSQGSVVALRHLFDSFPQRHGFGASGLNFFAVPGVDDPETRRDVIVLRSLVAALDLLASPAFSAAFGGSLEQNDYRWGQLHRVVIKHPLGGPFSLVEGGTSALPAPYPDLVGVPVDGGFQTVDAAAHSSRAADVNDFVFEQGPTSRFVAWVGRRAIFAVTSLPGGVSGVLGSAYHHNLLEGWLENETFPLRARR